MNEKIVERLFPGTMEDIKKGKCPICKKSIGVFRGGLSVKEFKISGMCQNCQDKTFGWLKYSVAMSMEAVKLVKINKNVKIITRN